MQSTFESQLWHFSTLSSVVTVCHCVLVVQAILDGVGLGTAMMLQHDLHAKMMPHDDSTALQQQEQVELLHSLNQGFI